MSMRSVFAGVIFVFGVVLALLGAALSVLVLIVGDLSAVLPNVEQGFVQLVNGVILAAAAGRMSLLFSGVMMMALGTLMHETVQLTAQVEQLRRRIKKAEGTIAEQTQRRAAQEAFLPTAPAQDGVLPAPRRRANRRAAMQPPAETDSAQ